MKNRLIMTIACLLFFSLNTQASDRVPNILSAVADPVVNLTQDERAITRGENIRAPARVHAQTYCANYSTPSGESRCAYVSTSRRYAGNGKYWYRALFQNSFGEYYWSKY